MTIDSLKRTTTLALTTIAILQILTPPPTLAFTPIPLGCRPAPYLPTIHPPNPLAQSSSDNDDDGGSAPGSFFNRVPPQQPIPNVDENADVPFDESVSDLLRRRKSNESRARTPSTLDGVPTAKATGFAKPPSPSPPKPYTAIGTPTPPLNDINNPTYDDQGYTLYTSETTGTQSRVFEALIDYPCEFTLKIVGADQGNFAGEMVRVVAESCGVEVGRIRFSERVKGKWNSVTVHAPVESAEMLYGLYEKIDEDPRVKFKF